jgi:hypothetical protein
MPNVTTKRRLHNHDVISETEHLATNTPYAASLPEEPFEV